MKKLSLSAALLLSIAMSAHAGTASSVNAMSVPAGAVSKTWTSPTTKPFSFWYWMYGAVTKPAIQADLIGMKNVGLQGTYLMPIRSVSERPEYGGTAEQLTPAFWDVVDYALAQADSLGLEIGVHICDGFALAGGPWFTPEESMQKVVWTDTIVNVGQQRAKSGRKSRNARNAAVVPAGVRLPLYKGGTDIAAYAIPVRRLESEVKPVSITRSETAGSDAKNFVRANDPCWVTFEFEKGTIVRNVEIFPSGTNFQCQRMNVECSTDGEHFEHLTALKPARHGWQNTDFTHTFALPEMQDDVRYLRFSWHPDGTEPGNEDLDAAKWRPTLRLKKIVFRQDERLHQWEGKAAYAWRIAETTTQQQMPDARCAQFEDVVKVELDAEGRVITPLRPGTWRILRMAHATTGHTNATAGGGKGLECDKFSKQAVNKLIDNWIGQFAALPHGKAVKYLHVDSWECGCQNWSKNFAEEFKARRGYDIMPWLPVMAGVPMVSAAESERVLKDIRLTINDLVNDVFFTTVRDRAHAMGMQFSSESIAPTMVADGMDHYRYADFPMGEYWLNSPTHDKPNDMLDAISGGHIYGKKVIQAEGFTELRGVWDETPASIKTLLDRNFAMGMNRLFFHVNAHNPWMDRKPGMTLDGIGLFFQRDQIWYPEAGPFVDYVTRCSALLQHGRPVQDIAVFAGEEMPRRSVLPERLVSMLPGIFGKERVESERRRLENAGQPIKELPVGVFHSAGVVDTRDWVNALNGYQYDSFNPDALLRLAKAEDGCMVLPGGARYRVVVLMGRNPMDPNYTDYSPAVKAKIDELRNAGVIIVDQPYTATDFSRYGLRPDVELPKDMAYTHRSAEDGEIYFLSNQLDESRVITATFRDVAARTPYIYNAVDNTIRPAVMDGFSINVMLPANGSCFVLFPHGEVESLLAGLPTKPHMADHCQGVMACQGAQSCCAKAADGKATACAKNAEATDGMLVLAAAGTEAQGAATGLILSLRESGLEKQLAGLEDWTTADDVREKYFSGHGKYTMNLKLKKKPTGAERLALGKVCDIAHVWVNGIDCGIVWTAPYAVKVGHALKKGQNTIEIEVVNTWANAIRGNDNNTPPYPGIWTNARYRLKTPDLVPAGLMGPVVLF